MTHIGVTSLADDFTRVTEGGELYNNPRASVLKGPVGNHGGHDTL